MLCLYTLLFFVLGSSVVAHPEVTHPVGPRVRHPVIRPRPAIYAKLDKLLEGQGCAGPTTWFRTVESWPAVSGTKLLILSQVLTYTTG